MPTFDIETPSNTRLRVPHYRKPRNRTTSNLPAQPYYIGDDPRFDHPQNGVSCLLLRFSVLLGVFPNKGKFGNWPAIATTIWTVGASFSIAVAVYMNFGQWLVNKDLFRHVVLIGLMVNLNACLVSQCISLYRNHVKIIRIFENFDQTAWAPTVVTVLETLTMLSTGVSVPLVIQADTTKIVLISMNNILFNIMAIVAVQFGALIRDFASKISSLTTTLKSHTNTINHCLERYFRIVSLIQDTNEAYKWQILFVLSDVFFQLVVHWYFILTERGLILKINSMCVIFAEAGLVIYIATSCQYTQNKADAFISELYTALRNRSMHLADTKKVELIVRMNKPLGFSAGGVIEIRNGLLTSMMAAVVTYLVMLVQLQGGL